MSTGWNAFRLDLFQLDEPMRAALREMRPLFAKSLPGILARFYDKVRQHDPSCGPFQGRRDARGRSHAIAALGPDRSLRFRPGLR